MEEMSGGLTNRTYRVDAGERSGVLKLDDGPRMAPLNTRCDEAYVQTSAAKAGLAARVILADSGFYLTEYLVGTVWNRESLNMDVNLANLAKSLRRLHALPLTGRSFDAGVAARRYIQKNTMLDSDTVARCEKIISCMRLPHNLCCCHNDLVVENIIAMPELMFLDWEYACDNDPFFDLASVVEHHQLSDAQITVLLDSYLENYLDAGCQNWRTHLEKQRTLYLALLCLWMAARQDTDWDELQVVARRLSTRNF